MITKSGYATKKSNVTQEKVNSYRQLLNEPAQEETSTPVAQEQVKPVNIRDLSVSNVLPKPKVNISAGEVKPLNIRDFVNEINNTPEGKRANLTAQTDSLKKQINTKEQEYARANNISDWNTKRQEQSRIQQELNSLREQLDSKNKDLVMLGGYNLLSGEQVEQFNKNAPLTQKIDKALKYDIPTTAKKVGRTAMDLAMQIPTAVYDVYEGALDATVANVGAIGSTIADKTGNKDIANKIREGATKFVNITPSSKPLVEEAKNKGEGIYEPKVLGIKVRDALYSISNMITAAYSGGLPMMALSASGQNIEEALTDNQSLERAVAYGDISGAIEGLTEKMFDAVKIVGGGKFDKFLPKSAIGKLIGGSAGEGIEEIISNGLNPFVKQLTYEKGTYDLPDFYEYIKMLGESFWNGAVIGAIMKGGQDISTPQFREQYKQDVYTAVDKSKLPDNIKEQVKEAMLTPAQAQINQDLGMIRNSADYQRTQQTNMLPTYSQIQQANLAQNQVNQQQNIETQQTTRPNQNNAKNQLNRTQAVAKKVDTTQMQMPTAKTNAVYNTAKQLNIDTQLANRVMEMAKLTEVPVNGFVDVNPKIDGYYKNGAIYINKNSKKPQERIFVHELTHNIEKADGWQGLRDTIFNSNVLYNELAEKGQTLEEYRQLIKDTYAENEIQLNEDDIDREVIAKFAEQHLLKDQKSIDRMVQENPTFMQRVKNFIDDLVVKFKGTAEEKELLRIQRMYDKAFAESKQVETKQGGKTQYSTNTDNQGRQLSKQQQEFFKDSKVRDEEGRLKAVYHGTAEEFTIFDEMFAKEGDYGVGFYFSDVKGVAEEAAEGKMINKDIARYASGDKGQVMETYLDMKKPSVWYNYRDIYKYNKMAKEAGLSLYDYMRKNYDGIIVTNPRYENEGFSESKYYVVFEPNQIKNVDNTNPTSNPDIRYSVETRGQATVPKKPTVVDNIAPKTEQNIDDLPQETQKVARVLTKAPKKDLDLSFETVSDMLMRKIVDAGNTINTIGKLSNDETLYPMYNNTKQARQSAEYMIGEKQTDITGTKIVGNSLVEIFKPVKAKGEEYTGKFYEYLLHMHNIDRMAQDKPVFGESVTAEISRQKADELLKENPEFEKLANKVYVYNRNLMQWRVDSGLISQEQADIMNKMYPHYVPTFRDMSGTAGSKIVGNAVNIANTVRKATGGNRDILPLDLAMARQTMQTVQAAKRNLFGNRLLNDVLANKERAAKYITAIEKSEDGLDVDEQSDASLSQPNNNTNVFKIYRDGKSFNMYVNSGIFEGLRAISSQVDATDTNKLLNALSKPNTMFKQLVTGMNPMFLIKNPIRDIQDATLYSKNLRKFLNNYPKTFKEQLENSADWQLYKALGGVGSSFFDYETGIDKTLNKSKLQRLSDNTLGRIEELNMMTEQAPRFAEFKATIQRAGNRNYDTLMKAIYNAADVTVNFGRTGTITQVLNKTIVPFLNPSIQGADKLIRTLATTKGGSEWAKLVTKATLFGILPSVLNELIFGDDEEYENLNDRDKDTNFVFKYGDNKWIKIPKGRVISSLGNLANRGIRLAKGQEVNWGDYLSTLADQTAPISPFESNIVSPIMAVKNNKSWYGSDIVPQRLQQYEAKDQYDEKTDAFSKWLGGILNYSPKKINYLIDAYTGVIGDFALPLTTPTAEVNPFMKAFTIDGNFSNEIGNKFYETKDKYSKYKNDKPSAVVVTRYLNKQNDMVNDLHAEIRKIQSSDVSDAEKKAKSGELRELINLIESTAIMNVKEYEKAVEKYINKFPNNKGRSEDYAYLMANKEMFGAEYAVKAYSTKKYNDNRKKNMNTVFNEIIKNYSKVKTPVAEQEKETLPTALDIPRKIK